MSHFSCCIFLKTSFDGGKTQHFCDFNYSNVIGLLTRRSVDL